MDENLSACFRVVSMDKVEREASRSTKGEKYSFRGNNVITRAICRFS